MRHVVTLLVSRLGMGGAERHTITLANQLAGCFDIALAYLKPDEELIGSLEKERLVELRSLRVKSRIDRVAVRDLVALMEVHDSSVIVCANGFALLYAQLTKLLSRRPIKVIQVLHTTLLPTLKDELIFLVYRPLFWAADHLVFVCDRQRRHWLRRGLIGRSNHVIYNGVDLGHFDPKRFAAVAALQRQVLGFPPNCRVIAVCAVLRPEKAHSLLLRAVSSLKRNGLSWKVMLIGDGPLRQSLQNEVVNLGLQGDVAITGFQNDVRPWLAAADVVALPSTAETFSIAALESMAMGKAMLMSDVGGAREQVEHGVNGYIFPSGDADALEEALRDAWDLEKTHAMGRAARDIVASKFSQQTMIREYEQLIRTALGR